MWNVTTAVCRPFTPFKYPNSPLQQNMSASLKEFVFKNKTVLDGEINLGPSIWGDEGCYDFQGSMGY